MVDIEEGSLVNLFFDNTTDSKVGVFSKNPSGISLIPQLYRLKVRKLLKFFKNVFPIISTGFDIKYNPSSDSISGIAFFSGLPSQTERELGTILKDLFLIHNLSLIHSKKHLVVNKDMKPIIEIFEHHNGTLSEKVLMDLLQNSKHFQKFDNDIFQFILYFLNHLKVKLKGGIRYYSMKTKIGEIVE